MIANILSPSLLLSLSPSFPSPLFTALSLRVFMSHKFFILFFDNIIHLSAEFWLFPPPIPPSFPKPPPTEIHVTSPLTEG